MKKPVLIAVNLIFIGAIAFFLLNGKGDITGYAVKQGAAATYVVHLNLTDIESGETMGMYVEGRDVFFAKQKPVVFDEKKLVFLDEAKITSNGAPCEKSEFMQRKHYYDENGNGFYDADEPYIFSVETDRGGCVIAELPDEGYKAMLALH